MAARSAPLPHHFESFHATLAEQDVRRHRRRARDRPCHRPTFQDEGATVILTDRDADTGIAAAESIRCRFEPLDVSDEADWARLADIVPAADVVVNNAGITGFEDGFAESETRAFDELVHF